MAPTSRHVSWERLYDIVEEGDDMEGVVVELGKITCSPVWAAVVSADETLLGAVLQHEACRLQVNTSDLESGCCPIHLATKLRLFEAVEALVKVGADVNVQNKDLFGLGAGGFKLLPECGGCTPLHILCALQERDDTLGTCRMLLDAKVNVQIKDSLGLTAYDVALANENNRTCELLLEVGAAHGIRRYTQKDLIELCREREVQWQQQMTIEKRVARKEMLSRLELSYPRRNPELFNADFLADCASSIVRTDGATGSACLSPGVFGFKNFLPPNVCVALLQELEAFEKWSSENAFEIARPNSMNRYGMVLNDIGFQEAMHNFMDKIVAPLARKNFPSFFGLADPPRQLLSQHSFVVRYQAGEDVDLKTHRDDSDFTLNLCLGKEFVGADVYFHAQTKGGCSTCSTQEAQQDEYAYPHPVDCRFCSFKHQHSPGTAILHLGSHTHGVNKLHSGERINLIIWCRFRPYPPEMAAQTEQA